MEQSSRKPYRKSKKSENFSAARIKDPRKPGTDRADKKKHNTPNDALALFENKNTPEDGKIRLNKLIADSGITSRRKADRLIEEGRVLLNGKKVYEFGIRVDPHADDVVVDGKPLRKKFEHMYIMFHKPRGVLTTMSDPEGRPTIADFLSQIPARVFPVGRLDWDSEGLLLLTNDGDYANKVTHPKDEVTKTYLVKINGKPTEEQLKKLLTGVSIVGGKVSARHIERIKRGREQYDWLKVIISEGKNRQIRQMFEKIGFDVLKLQRVAIGRLRLGNLERGEMLFLNEVAASRVFLVDDPEEIKEAKTYRGRSAKPTKLKANFISFLAAALIFSQFLTQSLTFAQEATPQPVPPAEVVINPDTLRTFVLSQNYSVQKGLNKVYLAKVKVSAARAALLPKLNLSGLFSGGGFALSTISFLMPFLNPGNWLELKASKELLQAEGQSFYISELNTYASVQSLYSTIVSDLALRKALKQKAENMEILVRIVKDQFNFGLVGEVDYRQAEAQMQLAQIQVSQIEELLIQELASLREMLALPLTTNMLLEEVHTNPSPYENQTATELLPIALSKSPEMSQLNFLIQASKITRWKAAFSFMSAATYSSTGNPANFGSLKPGAALTFDFGIFPTLEMSQLNIDLFEIQKKEVQSMHAQILEGTLGGLREANKQLELATNAVANQQIVYQAQLEKYNLGTTDLFPVIQASNDQLTTMMALVKAQANLDNLRVNLNRIVLDDQFSKIKTCNIETKAKKGNFLSDLFKGKQLISIEEACR